MVRHRADKKNGLAVDNIDAGILAEIEEAAKNIEHGSITLIVQDTLLIQMDVNKKVRFIETQGKSSTNSRSQTSRNAGKDSFGERIAAALKGMNFGQVVLVIKEGRIVQVERTEKLRFQGLEGIYGEGI